MPDQSHTVTGKSGEDWTVFEVEAIVADYLDMLQLELSGVAFNKAERNRNLQTVIARSKGAIEFKHQNISAVLTAFGLPFIRGYKPARNYQTLLFEIMEDRLIETGLAETLSGSEASLSDASALRFVDAPVRSPEPETRDPVIRRIIAKFDPAARDARLRKLGEAGEAYLFKAEQARLSEMGRDDLSAKVRWVAKEDGDGAGYDILSYARSGAPRWLEVKTTNGPRSTPFFLTSNEHKVAEANHDRFRLVRLFDFSRQPAAFRLKPPLSEHVRLEPSVYRASF